ncbi:Acrylyl-CoA reductase AcuI [Andreprevotia sp. IGB-42]|uniref:acrylyl-CoA reductase (NADPH) n=1 Tax=Andreprevotia sp. IGB-42 TaxID=2497473 RepID=UPI00135AC89A|nr:MDR family oxidoreductase [Andreprevotia sp. IGB-42]KAF0813658.1 Acrylyl-CoA reductase AcuI [Andreprevotia sp. IGB-42]
MFEAIWLNKDAAGFSAALTTLDDALLPADGITVRVDYSTLNYKDALAISNSGAVVRSWPMVPGVDAAGTVIASDHAGFAEGDAVIFNGWGAGETRWGALAQKARLPAEGMIKRPAAFSARHAMALGTAGYTAMLCVQALEKHGVRPDAGPVLVSGATGGVGSIAILLLAQRGYEVTALTGKPESVDYLQQLGAAHILDRRDFAAAGKPLQKTLWAAAIDTAGSHTLANVCAQLQYGGIVAACGLAQGMDLPATVAPFILRGITLAGIDSVFAPQAVRQQAWDALAAELDPARLDAVLSEIGLAEVIGAAGEIIAGRHTGRYVVDVNR